MKNKCSLIAFLLVAHFVTPSCGGDDGKTKDSAGGSGAKARALSILHDWGKKSCEVFSKCQNDNFSRFYSSVDECVQDAEAGITLDTRKGGPLDKADSCYAKFVDNYETCKNTVVSKDASQLCSYFGKTAFFDASQPNTIYEVFPECGGAQADLKQVEASAECGYAFAPLAFVPAPRRLARHQNP